jgi:F-type H+-transporting ATPase subunit b
LKRIGALARVLVLAGACAVPLVAQHEAASQHGESSDHTTLWKFGNFIILIGAAAYFLYKRGGAFFAGRTEEIRRGLTEAAKLRAEAEARYADMERRLAGLGEEIEKLRRLAHEESGAEGERLRRATEQEMKDIQAQAQREISAAAKAARQHLRAFSAELAIGLAAGRIRARLTPEADGALVASMVHELGNRFPDQPGGAC